MKTQLISAILALPLALASCSSGDDNGNSVQNITPQALTNTFVNHDWRISYFREDGVDRTAEFAGYIFTFDSNGTVTATSGESQVLGQWLVNADDDQDDDLYDNPDFILNYPASAPAPFLWLNDDWEPIERTGNRVRLIDDFDDDLDDSPDDEDELIFERP